MGARMTVTHEAYAVDMLLNPMIETLGMMADTLGPNEPEIVAPIRMAEEALKEAILRDERGPVSPPEHTDAAANWEAPPMPQYVAAAIKGELTTLKDTSPQTVKGVLANTSYQIARWSGGGYLRASEGRRTIWKVATASGAIAALGRARIETIIKQSWARGEKRPRQAPLERKL